MDSTIQKIKKVRIKETYYFDKKVDFGPLEKEFKIIREIGRGGFGCVYEAKSRSTDSLWENNNNYVIKMISSIEDPK